MFEGQKQIQIVKIRDNVPNEAINHIHPSEGDYSWWKFREAWSRSLHNLTVLSQIWTCLLLHPPVCPSVCVRADPPAASSVCVPSSPIVCFDLRHSTWSPSSSVPFPNTRHPPRCTSTGFISPTPSSLCGLLLKWREVKKKQKQKNCVLHRQSLLLETKEKTKASSGTYHFCFKRTG